MKNLVCFDFCNTVVHGQTIEKIREVFPGEEIPADIRALAQGELPDWVSMLDRALEYAQSTLGVSNEEIKEKILSMEFIDGMAHLIKTIPSIGQSGDGEGSEVLIVSDSSMLFVTWPLQAASLMSSVAHIVANPSQVDTDTDRIWVKPYHKNDWCTLSTPNLCKGKAVRDYVEGRRNNAGVTYDRVVFVGDGRNDLCAGFELGEKDLLCARRDFPLHQLLEAQGDINNDRLTSGDGESLKAKVIVWSTGDDILRELLT